jgi:hypothetical protein
LVKHGWQVLFGCVQLGPKAAFQMVEAFLVFLLCEFIGGSRSEEGEWGQGEKAEMKVRKLFLRTDQSSYGT